MSKTPTTEENPMTTTNYTVHLVFAQDSESDHAIHFKRDGLQFMVQPLTRLQTASDTIAELLGRSDWAMASDWTLTPDGAWAYIKEAPKPNGNTADPMTPVVTRKALPNGYHRYEVDGKVHTARSRRVYTHASVFCCSDGSLAVFLHSRKDLAVAGNQDAKRAGWAQRGWVSIDSLSHSLPGEGDLPKSDPDCDDEGHEGAIEEHGWCPVCQH